MFFCELSGAHDNTITPFKRDDELFRPLSTGTKLSRRGGRAILTALGVRYPKENDISRRAGKWARALLGSNSNQKFTMEKHCLDLVSALP